MRCVPCPRAALKLVEIGQGCSILHWFFPFFARDSMLGQGGQLQAALRVVYSLLMAKRERVNGSPIFRRSFAGPRGVGLTTT